MAASLALGLLACAGGSAAGTPVDLVTGPAPDASTAEPSPPDSHASHPALSADSYPFGEDSAWRLPVAEAPAADGSAAMVDRLATTLDGLYGGVAAFNIYDYSMPVYRVAADTPRTDLGFDDCQGRGDVPAGLYGPGGQFASVPVPEDAVPSGGSDGAIAIWSPDTGELWEFWKLGRGQDGWQACWGGRIDDTASSPGYFEDSFGASASGLAVSAGLVTLEDLHAGRVDHALALAVPDPAAYPRLSYPAQRTDGRDAHPDALPIGSRLRLDPDLDVAALELHPVAEMVALAAQAYGFIVTDTSGTVAVVGEDPGPFTAETGVNPWEEALGGTPGYLVLDGFPWRELEVLEPSYGAPAAPSPAP